MEQQLNRYKYICLNPKCQHRNHQYIKKTEAEAQESEPCIDCGVSMKLMGEVMYGGVGGNFRLSTPEQRRKMLLRRSSEHYKKSGIAEKKHQIGIEYKRQAIEHFKQKR